MALIKCPECGNQVSTAAASCPKCGSPIASASAGIHVPLATMQRTSKQLKAQGCFSGVVICIGLSVLFIAFLLGATSVPAMVAGAIMTIIGAVWVVITRIRIWWHHE